MKIHEAWEDLPGYTGDELDALDERPLSSRYRGILPSRPVAAGSSCTWEQWLDVVSGCDEAGRIAPRVAR